MKKVFLLIALLSLYSQSFSQNPTYTLTVKNFELGDSLFTNDMIKFEVFMTHTNAPTDFEYAGCQFYFSYNTAIASGSSDLEYRVISGSDLPSNLRPRNPFINTAANPTANLLSIGINTFPGVDNGYLMTDNAPVGTKIIKMRLRRKSGSFNSVPLDLAWRNYPSVQFISKVFAYVDGVNVDITTPTTHTIEYNTGSQLLSGVVLDLRVIPEGLYDPVSNTLSRDDNVKAYLRNSTPPYDVVEVIETKIDRLSLNGIYNFHAANPGTYYISIKHLNSLEVWSKTGGEIFNDGSRIYDFTTSAGQAFGDNLKLKGVKYCLWSGDTNQDGIIDGSDLASIDNDAYNFLPGINLPTDLNGDGIVDGADFQIGDNNRTYHSVITP